MDTLRNQAIAAVYEAIGRQAQAVEPGDDGAPIYIPAIVDAVIDAVLPSAIERARREALEEAAGVLEEEAADWIADANDAEADGHPRIAADFRRWAKEASKRARRIRALASQPAPPSGERHLTAEERGVMQAWWRFKDSAEYANAKRWAAQPKHLEGSLWRLFYEGHMAGAAEADSAIERARREALEEAAGVLEEEAADWIADANDAEADGHPRIAADFRRWAKEASKRARRIRALASQPPAPPKEKSNG